LEKLNERIIFRELIKSFLDEEPFPVEINVMQVALLYQQWQ